MTGVRFLCITMFVALLCPFGFSILPSHWVFCWGWPHRSWCPSSRQKGLCNRHCLRWGFGAEGLNGCHNWQWICVSSHSFLLVYHICAQKKGGGLKTPNLIFDFMAFPMILYRDLVKTQRFVMVWVWLIWVFPKIRVPPQTWILIGFSIINHPFWGTPIFGKTHFWGGWKPEIIVCLRRDPSLGWWSLCFCEQS